MTANTIQENTNKPPEKKKSVFKEIAGRYITSDFWLNVGKHVFQECIRAFMQAMAGVLMSFAKDSLLGNNTTTYQQSNNGYYTRSFGEVPPPTSPPPGYGMGAMRPATPTGSEQKSYPVF